ncbi:MAG: peptide-methionine (S)-S-oxide reductase MsrA [Rhodobacteraceae bacterium]|nr:peptide-methionine (S)-S-oxide reductase MsrA [Paracoccaceae bacterium]
MTRLPSRRIGFALAVAVCMMTSANSSSFAATESAIFAGGCFWCVESDFDSVDGVIATTSGYTGGHLDNPTYKDVTRGRSGHYEAVKIDFNPDLVSYRELTDLFFRSVDPTDPGGQFCDRGDSYRTAIFALDEQQQKIAESAKTDATESLGMPIVTPILNASTFFPAEERHQNYYAGDNRVLTRFGVIRQSEAYKRYRMACRRDERVKMLWGNQAVFAH